MSQEQFMRYRYPVKQTSAIQTRIPEHLLGKTFKIDISDEVKFYGPDYFDDDVKDLTDKTTGSQFTVLRLLTALCNGNAFKDKVKFQFAKLVDEYEYEDPELEFKLKTFDAFIEKLKQFLDAGKKDYQFFDEIETATEPTHPFEKFTNMDEESGKYFQELCDLVSIPSVAAIININIDSESEEFVKIWSTPIIEKSTNIVIRENGTCKSEKNVWNVVQTPKQIIQHDDHFTFYEDGITDFANDTIDAYQEIIFDSICGKDSIEKLGLDRFVASLLIFFKWHLIAPQFVMPSEDSQEMMLEEDSEEDNSEEFEECDSGNGSIVVSTKDGTIVMIKKYEIIAWKIVITEIIYVQEIKRKKFIFNNNLKPIAFCL